MSDAPAAPDLRIESPLVQLVARLLWEVWQRDQILTTHGVIPQRDHLRKWEEQFSDPRDHFEDEAIRQLRALQVTT